MISEALANHDIQTARRYFKENRPDISHIPGHTGLPILGNVPAFLKDAHKLMNDRYKKHGKVFKFHAPLNDGVFLIGTEANKLLLQNEDKLFSNFLAWDLTFANIFDNNVLERDFSSHKSHRKILQLAFKRPAIEDHIELMNPMMAQGVNNLPLNKKIKMLPFIKRLLLNVGANVFLGESIGAQTDKLNKAFVQMVAATADPFKKNIPLTPFSRGIKGRDTMSNFIFDNIGRKRSSPGRDLLSQLCHLRDEDGQQFSDEDIRDHIIFLLFAAHDTTTSAMSSVLYSIATHTEWQENIYEEIARIDLCKQDGGGTNCINHDDLDTMEKTSLVIKESLRMYPPLILMPRYALREFEYAGHRIPANSTVVISSLFTHYMEEYWSRPTSFDPLRFAPERAEDKKDFFQYIPFGGGAHKCLGLHFAEVQGKMFLYHFLKRYRVSIKKGTPYRYNNVPLTFPTDGLPLILQQRNPQRI